MSSESIPLQDFLSRQPDYPIVGEQYKRDMRFETLNELMPTTSDAALYGLDKRRPLVHKELSQFVRRTDLARFGLRPGDRCGVAVPNGPELALCIFCVAAHACVVPVNPDNSVEEVLTELRQAQTKALIVQAGARNEHLLSAAAQLGLLVLSLQPSRTVCGVFTLTPLTSGLLVSSRASVTSPAPLYSPQHQPMASACWNQRHDIVLLIFTSGTSGTKKVVPFTLESLLVGATCIAKSWQLTRKDVTLNMMPLFHIGGIARNVFAALLSGGAVVCAPGFEAALWWEVSQQGLVTWYYAGPTIHMALIEEAERLQLDKHNRTKLRFVANAAGGLLPSLAVRMQQVFGQQCAILPGYGMSECMPISAPPLDYKLTRPGSSGRAVGPEVAILDEETGKLVEAAGVAGTIVIRGCPLMAGYEDNAEENKKVFLPGGWFNTGDLGYLDADDYLYVTGRNKEVIKRGGETLSPSEIEEVLQSHPRVAKLLAFSVPHDTLMEVVGIVVVGAAGLPAPGLPDLHTYCAGRLHPSKWPQCLVLMNDLPSTASSKVQRIGLAARLGLSPLKDKSPLFARTFEASCPPKGASIKSAIACWPVQLDLDAASHALQTCSGCASARVECVKSKLVGYVEARRDDGQPVASNSELLTDMQNRLPGYLVPQRISIAKEKPNEQDEQANATQDKQEQARAEAAGDEQIVRWVMKLWCEVLELEAEEVAPDSDFFHLGGSSLKAGRLTVLIRKSYNVPFDVTAIFAHRTPLAISRLVAQNFKTSALKEKEAGHLQSTNNPQESFRSDKSDDETETLLDQSEDSESAAVPPHNSSHPVTLLIQLLPMALFYPLRRVSTFLTFAFLWANFCAQGWDRVLALVAALLATNVLGQLLLPWLGIACKWLLIGRFRSGRYPLFGGYYLRWWLTSQLLAICGRGMFLWSPALLVNYYRLLGAKIGYHVKLSKATRISEPDLVWIKDGCVLDAATVRAFCLDQSSMLLKPIVIGEDCTVGLGTVLAPGTKLPNQTCLGPLSSSYELHSARRSNRALARPAFAGPHWCLVWLLGYPLLVAQAALARLPELCVLFLIAQQVPRDFKTLGHVLQWFTTPDRLVQYVLLRVCSATLRPLLRLLVAIAVKRLVLGRFTEGPRDRSAWCTFRYWLMSQLVPNGALCGVAELVGKHYSCVSFFYRALGAKVGKHVYWPGSGVNVVEYDLLEIGDNVVFGSRSAVMCSDAKEYRRVTIGHSANVSDRCLLLPGVLVEPCAVLGSGSLAAKNTVFPRGSTWVGSSNGCTVMLIPPNPHAEPAPSRFAKAFYFKQAPYWVFPEWLVVLLNVCWAAFVHVFQATPMVASLYFINSRHALTFSALQLDTLAAVMSLFAQFLATFSAFFLVFCLGAVCISVAAKWALLGQRTAKSHSWDEDDYCQRWQLLLMVENIRRHNFSVLEFLAGSQWLVFYFRALGGTVGEYCCLYPNGGDPMMTEPDLVVIGDRCCVDEASLIAHVNSRGQFQLNRLRLHNDCTLRTGSRLLSGGEMEAGSTLLEHTLMLGGDIAPAHTVWQGWPAQQISTHSVAGPSIVKETVANSLSPSPSSGSLTSLLPPGDSPPNTPQRRSKASKDEAVKLTIFTPHCDQKREGFIYQNQALLGM